MTDQYLWLEDVLSEKSLSWVKNENAETIKKLTSWNDFKEVSSKIQKSLETKDKIPMIRFMSGNYVYNLWTDEVHLQGIFRRATTLEFGKSDCSWELLIDFDLESKKDNQKWVFHHFDLSPNEKKALISMSPGGTDADIIREFCLETKTFLSDGFKLELSKGQATWLNENELLVMRVFGEDSVTSCGYPRTLRSWKRGTELSLAPVLFEIPKEESFLFTESRHFKELSRIIVHRRIDFYSGEIFLLESNLLKKINLPKKIDNYGMTESHFYFQLQENWQNFKIGDIIAYYFEYEKSELIFRPELNSSVYSGGVTKNGIQLIVDRDVKSELYYVTKKNNEWSSEKINLPSNGSLDSLVTSSSSDDFYVAYDSYNYPVTYFHGSKTSKPVGIKTQPSFFKHDEIEVHQHFTKSLDGTRIPYFLVHKKGLELNSKNPTILYGYGGFEISLKPHFSNALGIGWLERGGVYVLSNIRGGGEYGPAWHQCALKHNRERTYQDFFAIAEDLFAKKITSPAHLGAKGGSNGGLLMGVCYTKRPDLFKAIDCGVPLLDMQRYHKLLAGHSWIAEYGNPDDEKDGEYIRNLSPYHRIDQDQKNYPVMYLNTSTKDDRVHPGHARKFAAKLKEYKLPFYYYENIDGGHAGAANMTELANNQTFVYSFFWEHLR